METKSKYDAKLKHFIRLLINNKVKKNQVHKEPRKSDNDVVIGICPISFANMKELLTSMALMNELSDVMRVENE